MFPVLLKLGPVTIYSFGVMLAVGFWLWLFLAWRRLKELGLVEEKLLDMLILSTALGAFFAWGVYRFEYFFYRGASWWGGVAGLVLVVWGFSKKERWDFWQILDEVVYALVPFTVVFNLGLFLDGFGGGKPTSLPWGIFYPGILYRSHPLTLYSAVFFFLVWLIVLKVERDWRSWPWLKERKNGFIFLFYAIASSIFGLGIVFLSLNDIYWRWIRFGLGGTVLAAAAVLMVLRVDIWPKKNRLKKQRQLRLKGKEINKVAEVRNPR